MEKPRIVIPVLLFVVVLLSSGTAMANTLEGFLDEVDLRASRDLGSFRADLRLTFDVTDKTLDGLFRVMSDPSDVYMCLRLSEVAHQPIELVVEEHRQHKGQGWGVIAKNLGVKPGSEEFHALKADRLSPDGGGSTDNRNKGKKN